MCYGDFTEVNWSVELLENLKQRIFLIMFLIYRLQSPPLKPHSWNYGPDPPLSCMCSLVLHIASFSPEPGSGPPLPLSPGACRGNHLWASQWCWSPLTSAFLVTLVKGVSGLPWSMPLWWVIWIHMIYPSQHSHAPQSHYSSATCQGNSVFLHCWESTATFSLQASKSHTNNKFVQYPGFFARMLNTFK